MNRSVFKPKSVQREIIEKVGDYYRILKEYRLGVWHLKGIKMLREDVILFNE